MTNSRLKTKNATPQLTPKLRFSEFRDDPGWDAKPGYELFDQITNREARAGLPILAITQEHGAIPRDEIDYHVSVTDKSVETYKEVCPGDFIISLRSFQGGIEYSRYHGICSPAYVILRKKGELSDDFFKHLFKSYSFIQQLTKNLEGLRDGKMISYSQFSELLLPFPQLAEQQKIAECLGALDELIGSESRKLDALKSHKQGLMQQLFPREGETRPRLRFPEFRDGPGWEDKVLGAVLPITSSKRVHESEWSETGVPFYRAREIVALNKQVDITPLHISEELYSVNIKLSGEISAGHLLVTGVGSIGVPYLVMASDRFYFKDGNIVWLKNDEAEIIGEFLLRLYETDFVQTQIRKMSDVGTVATYTIENAKRTRVIFPEDKSEQHRIATCLSFLDDLIDAQSDKIKALKTYKLGLMQQLFPSPSEAKA